AHAPAGAAGRRRQPRPAGLHRPGADGGPPAGDRTPLRPADRVRLRPVGVALRDDLAPGHPALRHPRRHPPAPDAGPDQRGPGHAGGQAGGTGRGRRAGAAKPGGDARLLGDARGDRPGAPPRRLAADRRPGGGGPRRHLHDRRPGEGLHPPAGREPGPRRGRGGAGLPSGRRRGGRGRRPLGADGRGREGLRGPGRRRQPGRRRRCRRPGPRRPPRLGRRAPHPLQGPPLHRDHRRAAPHPHRPGGQAPPAEGPHPGRMGRRRLTRYEPAFPTAAGPPSGTPEWRAMADESWLRTGIGRSTPEAITVRGRDLATELMGKVTFSELAFLLTADRMPSAGETRLFDAALVSLADHGLTPSVLAARLTWTGATDSLQGAVAAGLLGAGNVFLGVVEDTARFLAAIIADDADNPADAAERAVRTEIAARRRIPGLGHPVHKAEDPRTPRLYAIAREADIPTPHLELLRTVADAHAAATGKALPING